MSVAAGPNLALPRGRWHRTACSGSTSAGRDPSQTHRDRGAATRWTNAGCGWRGTARFRNASVEPYISDNDADRAIRSSGHPQTARACSDCGAPNPTTGISVKLRTGALGREVSRGRQAAGAVIVDGRRSRSETRLRRAPNCALQRVAAWRFAGAAPGQRSMEEHRIHLDAPEEPLIVAGVLRTMSTAHVPEVRCSSNRATGPDRFGIHRLGMLKPVLLTNC